MVSLFASAVERSSSAAGGAGEPSIEISDMDRRPPRDGVHRAAGPVGQLVQSSVHPSLQVDGSPSGEAWGPRDPVLLGLVIGPCHAEAPPLRHPHSDAPLSVRCSRSRRTPREPLDTRHDPLEQGPCQVDDTALAPVTSRSVISALGGVGFAGFSGFSAVALAPRAFRVRVWQILSGDWHRVCDACWGCPSSVRELLPTDPNVAQGAVHWLLKAPNPAGV